LLNGCQFDVRKPLAVALERGDVLGLSKRSVSVVLAMLPHNDRPGRFVGPSPILCAQQCLWIQEEFAVEQVLVDRVKAKNGFLVWSVLVLLIAHVAGDVIEGHL